MYLFVYVFYLLPVYCLAGKNFSCFSALSGSKRVDITPLPETYRVFIEFVDTLKQFSADITEYYEKSRNLSVLRCERGTDRFDCIIDRAANMFSFVNKSGEEVTCNATGLETNGKSPHSDSFFFPNQLPDQQQKAEKSIVDRDVVNFYDLIQLINSSEILIVHPTNHSEHDHGIPVQHLLACKKSSDQKFWLEFNLCLSDKNFSLNGVKKSQSVPTRVDLQVYDNNEKNQAEIKTYFDAVYEMTGYKTNLEDEDYNFHLPPQGVYCHGRNQSKPVPSLPKDFSVSIEHIDHNLNVIDNSQLYYNDVDKLIAVEFSRTLRDEPITFGLDDNLGPGHYRVVQDYKSGIQYSTEIHSSRCLKVQAIPGHAGTRKPSEKDLRAITMKDAFELLFVLPPSKYTYVGTRFDNGLKLDVWNAFEETRTKDSQQKELIAQNTYEIWASSDNWTRDGFLTSSTDLPFYFKTYYTDNYNRNNVTVQKFTNFIGYDNLSAVFWPDSDPFYCLLPGGEYVVSLNDSYENVKKVGIGSVTRFLREKLSEMGGISRLRIGNIKFWETSKDNVSTNVSFVVARPTDTIGAKTEFSVPELKTYEASTKINQTLASTDIIFNVSSTTGNITTYKLRKGFFVVLPVFPVGSLVIPPSLYIKTSSSTGYTGGSMASMAFFMLFLGGGAGVILAYQYVKRARGGIAYQIYE